MIRKYMVFGVILIFLSAGLVLISENKNVDGDEFWRDIVFDQDPTGTYYIDISQENDQTVIKWYCGLDACDDYQLCTAHTDQCKVWKSEEDANKEPPDPIEQGCNSHDRGVTIVHTATFAGDDWTCWCVKLDIDNDDDSENDEGNNKRQGNDMVSQIDAGNWVTFDIGVSNPSLENLEFDVIVGELPTGWDSNEPDSFYVDWDDIYWFKLDIYMPIGAQACDITISNPCYSVSGYDQTTTIHFVL